MDQAKIDRINALARKSRETALTEAEAAEQKALRAEYIASVRRSLESELENTCVIDESGKKRRLRRLP